MIARSSHTEVEGPPRVSILIPAYGARDALQRCLDSLAKHAPANSTITILDDGTLDDSIEKTYQAARNRILRLGYYRSERNRGFVGICNWACQHLREPGSDLLLLNSDTEVTAGFLDEMQAVLYLHDRHAVATPRSNKATIFSVPWVGGVLPEEESYEIWKQLRDLLPRYQVMPTAVGFCMLIKAEVLDRFSLFDEVYSPGYNEENDFVCRINRYGYSAVAANWAYVFHHAGSSFGPRQAELEARNSKVLAARYPEYERKVSDYTRYFVDPVEVFASLYAPHKPRILFDLRDLQPLRYGTSEVGLNLLREVRESVGDDVDLYVGVGEARDFFASELTGNKTYHSRSGERMLFDLAFRPFQIFTWSEFHKLNEAAPRIAYQLLDIILVRCEYLNSPDRRILFRRTAELSDSVISISEYSKADFEAFYGPGLPMTVIHPGTNLAPNDRKAPANDYVLIMGNNYAHKGVWEAVDQLRGASWNLSVLAGEPGGTVPDGVRWLVSGHLPDAEIHDLMLGASVVVYPSHYEGFGLPVVDALALGKSVVVLDTAITRELEALTRNQNLHRIRSAHNLRATVMNLFARETIPLEGSLRTWSQAAEECVAALRELLARPIDVPTLRKRWDAIRTVRSVSPW